MSQISDHLSLKDLAQNAIPQKANIRICCHGENTVMIEQLVFVYDAPSGIKFGMSPKVHKIITDPADDNEYAQLEMIELNFPCYKQWAARAFSQGKSVYLDPQFPIKGSCQPC
jgi:hypothetical protein